MNAFMLYDRIYDGFGYTEKIELGCKFHWNSGRTPDYSRNSNNFNCILINWEGTFLMYSQHSNFTSFLLFLCRHFTVFSSTSVSCLPLTSQLSLEDSSFLQSPWAYLEST
jgi:hypothetical protein